MNKLSPLIPSLLLSISLAATAETLEIPIQGMTCPFCADGLHRTLGKLPGVEKAEVSLKLKKARLTLEEGAKLDQEAVRKVIIDSGFTPGKVEVK
jgi:copper chaperone CopZ